MIRNKLSKVNNNIARSTGQIRIIGGCWRGRKLSVPYGPRLRPTTNRTRETVFNWLAPIIRGAHCLDCFAGSGALSMEALSRGAKSVILLECNRAISVQLAKNLQVLRTQQAQVINTNSLRWLTQSGRIFNHVFNIVFIDPPFRQNLIKDTVALLEWNHHLADDAWIYIETETESLAPEVPDYWQLHREKIAGQVAYRIYIRHAVSGVQYNTD